MLFSIRAGQPVKNSIKLFNNHSSEYLSIENILKYKHVISPKHINVCNTICMLYILFNLRDIRHSCR